MRIQDIIIDAACTVRMCASCLRGQLACSAADLEEQSLVLRQICARKQEEVRGVRAVIGVQGGQMDARGRQGDCWEADDGWCFDGKYAKEGKTRQVGVWGAVECDCPYSSFRYLYAPSNTCMRICVHAQERDASSRSARAAAAASTPTSSSSLQPGALAAAAESWHSLSGAAATAAAEAGKMSAAAAVAADRVRHRYDGRCEGRSESRSGENQT